VGHVVARLALGDADGEVAPHLARQAGEVVAAERQVFADEAVWLLPVAGGQHDAALVHHEDGEAADVAVEPLEKAVGRRHAARRAGLAQQGQHLFAQLDGGGDVGVAVDDAVHRRAEEVEAVAGVGAQGLHPLVFAGPVAAEADQPDHQQQGQHDQRPRRQRAGGGTSDSGAGRSWGSGQAGGDAQGYSPRRARAPAPASRR
jgi:hypothetical protein